MGYREDKNGCYTTARKVCSERFEELIAWATKHSAKLKGCAHCDTRKFPFPPASMRGAEGTPPNAA